MDEAKSARKRSAAESSADSESATASPQEQLELWLVSKPRGFAFDESGSTGHDAAEEEEQDGKVKLVKEDLGALSVQLRTLNDELTCVVCLGILRDVRVVMDCLHRFCSECIGKSMRLGNRECPTCRAPLTSRRDLREDKRFDALVAAIYGDLDQFEQEQEAAIQRINKHHLRSKTLQQSMARGRSEQEELKGGRVPTWQRAGSAAPAASASAVSSTSLAPQPSQQQAKPKPPRASQTLKPHPTGTRVNTAAGPPPAAVCLNGQLDGRIEFQCHRHTAETSLPRLEKPKLIVSAHVAIRSIRKFVSKKLNATEDRVFMYTQDVLNAQRLPDEAVLSRIFERHIERRGAGTPFVLYYRSS